MVLGVVVVAVALHAGYQALRARSELVAVAHDFQAVKAHLAAGDVAAARTSLREAQLHSHQARGHTDGPVWGVLGHAPGVGDDMKAVTTVARVCDNLASGVLPNGLTAADRLTPSDLRPVDGRVDLAPLEQARPLLARVSRGFRKQRQDVDSIDSSGLTAGVAGPVRELQRQLRDASETADHVDRAVHLLPPMLGADGPRRYLLMFQNNAEIRSGGGVPGSFAVVTADHGRMRLAGHVSDATMGSFDKRPVPLTAGEKGLFGTTPGRFAQDVTAIPDFPRSAQLLAAMWRRNHDQPLDGVMSADPVALSQILRGTGPVAVPGGRLSADNAVSTLLSTTYRRISDPTAQDAYFAEVTSRVFGAVAAGGGAPRTVVTGVATAAGQRRLLVWSAHPAEQRLLDPTNVGGRLTTTTSSNRPQLGVYLNDNGASKLDYYLHYDVDVQPRNCTEGRQRMVVTLRLRSDVPSDTASLPYYVTNNAKGVPRGRILLTVLSYAPPGGKMIGEEIDGHAVTASLFHDQGRDVALRHLSLDPGHTQVIRWFVQGGHGQSGTPSLHVTPGVHSDGIGTVDPSKC